MRLRRVGVALSLALALCEEASRADGAARPAVEISVVQATATDSGASMDPALIDLSRHAREQPFLRFNTFKLLDRKVLAIQPGKPVTDALANGRTLEVTLLDVTADAGAKRFHLRAAIGEPGKPAVLKLLEVTASADEPFFMAGQAFRGGILFLEVVVRP